MVKMLKEKFNKIYDKWFLFAKKVGKERGWVIDESLRTKNKFWVILFAIVSWSFIGAFFYYLIFIFAPSLYHFLHKLFPFIPSFFK